MRDDWRAPAGQPRYSASLTLSIQVALLPSTDSVMAMCVIATSGAAPCLCFSPGREPYDVAGPGFLDGTAFALDPTGPRNDNQGLPRRMRVPCRARADLPREPVQLALAAGVSCPVRGRSVPNLPPIRPEPTIPFFMTCPRMRPAPSRNLQSAPVKPHRSAYPDPHNPQGRSDCGRRAHHEADGAALRRAGG